MILLKIFFQKTNYFNDLLKKFFSKKPIILMIFYIKKKFQNYIILKFKIIDLKFY